MSKSTVKVLPRYLLAEMSLMRTLGYMLLFNLLLVASSYIEMPLPFSPVPITAQSIAVLACGLFLGPVRGMATVMAYLLEGGLGLPVFAGGASGIVRIFGPTGGYLIGFVPAAGMVGYLSEQLRSITYGKLTAVLLVGKIMIFVPGLIMLSLFVPKGSLLAMGLYPFIPGIIVKIAVTATALTGYKRIRQSL